MRRGFDPREFTLVAFGGAGPLHAVDLAAALGIREIVAPLYPCLFSAQGLCQAHVLNEFVRTRVTRWEDANLSTMLATVAALEKEAIDWMDSEGIAGDKRALTRSMDMRYVGQNWELTVKSRCATHVGRAVGERSKRFRTPSPADVRPFQ